MEQEKRLEGVLTESSTAEASGWSRTMGWTMVAHPTVRTLRLALDDLLTREVDEDDYIYIGFITGTTGTFNIRKVADGSK